MNIKVGGIYIQRKGFGEYSDWPNLVIVLPKPYNNDRITNIEIIIAKHKGLIRRMGSPIGVFHHRLSTPTFSDILKCGDTISPKYKTVLKEFLEELANV